VKYTGTIFQGWGVRAILEGRKTNTRRLNGLKRVNANPDDWCQPYQLETDPTLWTWRNRTSGQVLTLRCPYGQVGDRLWVRESFSYLEDGVGFPCWYWADGNPEQGNWTPPKPSIHLPRIYSRITLELTGVKVERIQDISESDVEREGTPMVAPRPSGVDRVDFAYLWDSINSKRGYRWDVNPWVWALAFKVVE